MQLVARVAEAFGHLLPSPGSDAIDVHDRIRVTYADDSDIAFADLARAFELHLQFGGRNVSRSGDADGAPVILLVMASAHVDVAAGSIRRTGWRARTSRGRRPKRRCSAALARGDLDVIHRDLAKHRFLAAIRLGAK